MARFAFVEGLKHARLDSIPGFAPKIALGTTGKALVCFHEPEFQLAEFQLENGPR